MNSAGQFFWRGTQDTPTKGYGGKLTLGLDFSFSFSTSILPPGMHLNIGSGTYWEFQGDFLLGGGLRVETSSDGKSVTIDLKPSAGFAAYLGEGKTNSNTIASHPLTCTAP